METNSPNGGRQSEATRESMSPAQSQEDDTQSRQAVTGGGAQNSGDTGNTGTQAPTRERSRAMNTRSAGGLSRSSGTNSPFHGLTRLSREMDQLFDSFFGNRFGLSRLARSWPFESGGMGGDELSSLWTPNVDVRRRGDSLVIHAEVPGIAKEDVRIEATDQGIAISGERNETREEDAKERGYQLKERSYGSFYREIPLPEGAQADQAKATMREGVLEITVPLQQGQGRRQIQIE